MREGDSEGCEAIEDGDPDMNFGDLAVEITSAQALSQQLDAVHFRLNAASSMITAPSFPDSPSEMPASPQSFVSGDSSC